MTTNRTTIAYSSSGNYKTATSLSGEILVDRTTKRLAVEDGSGGWILTATKDDVAAITQTVNSKADQSAITTALAAKADATATANALNTKANTVDVTTSLAGKANISDVTTSLTSKFDIAPVSARSLLTHSYFKAMSDTYTNWVEGNYSNVINYANGGGIYFGTTQFDPSLGSPSVSMWMRGTLHHAVLNAWQLAVAAIAAGDTTQIPFRDRWAAVIEATWRDSTTNYSETNFRYSKQNGYLPLCVTMDDVGIVGLYLRDIAEYYGPTSTDGAKAISYLTSLLINALVRFRDPLQTGSDLIDYGVTDPVTGTAFKSNRYGVLYPDPSSGNVAFVSGGYSSSAFESLWGVLAMYLVNRGNLSASLKTAFQSYAVNTYTFLQNLKTGTPSDSSRPAQGQMFAAFNLDPNINANNNSSVNGGMAYRGSYDTNQRYHQPVDAYFGKGIRALTAVWDICTIWYGVLCAQLYQATNNATYLSEAVNSGNAMVSTQGCGRIIDGLLHIGNLRDPHSAGVAWPWYIKIMQQVKSDFDSNLVVRGALIRTARRIAANSDKGNLGPDWTGAEYSQNERTWTWGETSAFQGNGGSGQAKATQQMTHGCGLIMVVAAMSAVSVETAVDTADTKRSVVDQHGAMVSAMRSIADQSSYRTSWTVNGRLTIQDVNFYDVYEPAGPVRNFDIDGSGRRTFDSYNKNTYTREFWVQGTRVGHFDGGGFSVGGGLSSTGAMFPALDKFNLAFAIGADGNNNPTISFPNNHRDVMNLSSVNREFWIGNSLIGYWGGGGFGLMSANALRYSGDSSAAIFVSNTDGSHWHTYGSGGGYDNYNPSTQQYRRYIPGGYGYELEAAGMNLYGGITVGGVCWPDQANTRDLGGSNGKQWKNLFVQNSPSVSSDARYKTARSDTDGGAYFTPAELDAGLEVANNIRVWMRNTALENDTDENNPSRWHFGPYIQEVIQIFAKHGLVTLQDDGSLPTNIRYAAFLHSSWEATPEIPAVEADPGEAPSADGSKPGRPPTPGKPAVPARPAGDEWQLRNDYLQWLIQASFSREKDRMEARLTALEDALKKG